MTPRRLTATLCCLGILLVGCGNDDESADPEASVSAVCKLTEVNRRDMAKRDLTFIDLVEGERSGRPVTEKYVNGMGAILFIFRSDSGAVPADTEPVLDWLVETYEASSEGKEAPGLSDEVRESARKLDERVREC